MSESKRKHFSGEFKAKVALEAIRGVKTVNDIGRLKMELDWLKIEGKVMPIATNPRIGRIGRKRGTHELVAHES